MKVKDLREDINLQGIKVKIPKEFQHNYLGIKGEMYIYSSWNKGIWLKHSMDDSKIIPLCMHDVKQVLNFTVVKEKGKVYI